MGYPTNIEWADATWNPFGGCSVLSPGCTNCYAMKLAGTRLAHLPLYAGTTSPSKAGPVFNGTLTAAPDDHDVWTWPLRWKGAKQPKGGGARSRIFVGDMADLFHADRPLDIIHRVFAIAALAPQHDFLILTKRAEQMRDFVAGEGSRRVARACIYEWGARRVTPGPDWPVATVGDIDDPEDIFMRQWPLPNVWLGVSCEDQARADERVPFLLDTPAAVRFVSAEPLLGWIDLSDSVGTWLTSYPRLDWIIAGGESGPDARPMHPDWARTIRDQCAAAGVPFFFKQWGEWIAGEVFSIGDSLGHAKHQDGLEHGGVQSHWWSGEVSGGVISTRVGKHAAGRTLDGVTHDARPR